MWPAHPVELVLSVGTLPATLPCHMLIIIIALLTVSLAKVALALSASPAEATTRASREFRRYRAPKAGSVTPTAYLPRGRVIRIVKGTR